MNIQNVQCAKVHVHLYIVLKWSLTNKLISTCSRQSLILWFKSEIWHVTIYGVNQQVESVEALELHKMSESHIIMAGRKFWSCLQMWSSL